MPAGAKECFINDVRTGSLPNGCRMSKTGESNDRKDRNCS